MGLAAGLAQVGAVEPAPMPKVGDIAPLVAGKTQDNKTWRMADVLGDKAVLIYFYPKDNTPGCTRQACGWRDRLGELQQANVELVGISFDDVASHKAFADQHNLNFKLIADTRGQNADAYGVRVAPGKNQARRVSFLVDRAGRIVAITDSSDPERHLKEMGAAIARLKSN
jgi:peroxiredoxin Q/BCP